MWNWLEALLELLYFFVLLAYALRASDRGVRLREVVRSGVAGGQCAEAAPEPPHLAERSAPAVCTSLERL